jgi:hypothetical protein
MNRRTAFLLLCDCVSPCSHSPEQVENLRKELLVAGTEWEPLVQAANKHLLCPALYGALKLKDLLSFIPADLREYLQTLYNHNGERNHRLLDHAEETASFLNKLGVEPVLLKGTANLLSGLYSDPSTRFITDIDMLVPKDRIVDCVRKLRGAGYHYLFPPESNAWKNHHHCPPLLKNNRYFRIEMHHELLQTQYRRLIDAADVLKDSIPIAIGTARARTPSLIHRVIHNIAHAQLSDLNYYYGEIQLRQLYDLVLLTDGIRKEEWQKIEVVFRRFGYSSALAGYLMASNKFFNYSMPSKIKNTFGARLYLEGLCFQAASLPATRLANLARLAIYYGRRLKRVLSSHQIPQIWNRETRKNHYNQIMCMLGRHW